MAVLQQPDRDGQGTEAGAKEIEGGESNNGLARGPTPQSPPVLMLHKPVAAHRGRVRIGAGIYLLSVWMTGVWDQLPEIDRPAQAQRFDDGAGWFLLELISDEQGEESDLRT